MAKPRKSEGPEEGAPKKCRSFFFVWASSRGISVVFEMQEPPKKHVCSSLDHHVRASDAQSGGAARKNQPRKKNVIFGGGGSSGRVSGGGEQE